MKYLWVFRSKRYVFLVLKIYEKKCTSYSGLNIRTRLNDPQRINMSRIYSYSVY